MIEINQSVIQEVGFPFPINGAGSYRLTGNIDASGATTAVISIASGVDDVTIDLGGFAISGPNTCTPGMPPSCLLNSGLDGVLGDMSNSNITIRNGTIRGMSGTAVDLPGDGTRVDGVRVIENGADGIHLGSNCAVTNSTATTNAGTGIHAGSNCGGLGNVSQGNGTNFNNPLPLLGLIGNGQILPGAVTSSEIQNATILSEDLADSVRKVQVTSESYCVAPGNGICSRSCPAGLQVIGGSCRTTTPNQRLASSWYGNSTTWNCNYGTGSAVYVRAICLEQ